MGEKQTFEFFSGAKNLSDHNTEGEKQKREENPQKFPMSHRVFS